MPLFIHIYPGEVDPMTPSVEVGTVQQKDRLNIPSVTWCMDGASQSWNPFFHGGDIATVTFRTILHMFIEEFFLSKITAFRKGRHHWNEIPGNKHQVWKILHGEEDVEASTWFTMANQATIRATRNTSDSLNLSQPNWSNLFRKNFFSVRCVEQWNNLPSGLKSSSDINMFKNNYDSLFHTNNLWFGMQALMPVDVFTITRMCTLTLLNV